MSLQAPYNRRTALWWIVSAKCAETQVRRLGMFASKNRTYRLK
ncbi:MAG: YdeI/OmpD-associated family protein [Verrucomicrobia bacterium]|nr:YdeI/OmpD-associated family protein [Verrucomicrobiota bacterium]